MYSFTAHNNFKATLNQSIIYTNYHSDKKSRQFLKNRLLLIVVMLLQFIQVTAQKTAKIIVENSDFVDVNEIELPDATLLTGNVRFSHEGIIMTCNKAYYFKTENYIKTFGNVQMVQGDTLYLNSKYAEYSGNVKKAFATGDVVMRSPESTMTTDTIYFDRNSQEAYFNNQGTIINKNNTLKSKVGRYYLKAKKYQFLTAVVLTNPEYTIKSNHLDYYTAQGDSYLLGPSTITGKENFIYTENGYYNSKRNIGNFKKKSYIKYKDRLIEGDSLYYDRKREFASGTHNVKITDSINKAIIKGHYGEVFKNKDSLFITKHASVRYLIEKDSMFIHAKKIIVTGKIGERKITGFNNVRFFKTDLSGKCDSIHSNQKESLTKLIGKPILWNLENQMTGDVMHLIGNNKTEKLDSLKILNNSFIISKDTIGTGYNQIKGLNLYGKFDQNKLKEVDVVKNTEVIYYMRNEQNELIGINKNLSNKINMVMDDKSNVETITFYEKVDGDIYPEKDLPENARKLKGFIWRGEERIKNKEEIYPLEEVELDKKIVEESRKRYEFNKDRITKNEELLETKLKRAEKIIKIGSLPKDQNTMGNIDQLDDENESFKIRGWAAIKDRDANNSKIRIVLIGNKDKFSLSTENEIRQDVTVSNKYKYNYDDSGFTVVIRKSDIPRGKYNIGIIIKNSKNKQFIFNTTRTITN
jgi:lipopolysaccharide export system protein LptA